MSLLTPEPTDYILEKALAGERISAPEALRLYEEADFLRLASVARDLRR